jgi:hypothetical protein
MKKLFKLSLSALFAAVLTFGIFTSAFAATPNYLAVNVELVPFQISGQWTATTTSVIKYTNPAKMKLIGVSATARASGGTSPTLTVDVLAGGTTVLSAPISITAGTVAEGTIVTSTIADEAAVTVNLAITGTSPTWNDITILLTFVPL